MGHRVRMYRADHPDGMIFDSDELPVSVGWVDHPAKLGPVQAPPAADLEARVADLERQLEEASAERDLLRRDLGVTIGEGAPTPQEGEDHSEIVEAIGLLDKDKDFTTTGLPRVESIEAVVGYDISMAERDAAFAEYQQRNG